MESKALLSMSICLSYVLEHVQKPSILVFWGVISQYKTLMPLLRNSYLPQNRFGSSASSTGVTDIVNVPLVCLEAEILDHFFGVTPSCTSLGRWVMARRMLMVRSAVQRISFSFVGNKSSIYMNKCSK